MGTAVKRWYNKNLKKHFMITSYWINNNTGFLILSAIVIFGVWNVNFNSANQNILTDTRRAAVNTESIIVTQQENICILRLHAEDGGGVTASEQEKCKAEAQEIRRKFDKTY